MGHKEDRIRVPSPSSSPWLVYTHRNLKGNKQIQTFCTITSPSQSQFYVKSIPTLRGKLIVGVSYGWLILRDFAKRRYLYLWDPMTVRLLQLPPIKAPRFVPTMTINACLLTSTPDEDNNNCIILVFCKSFVFIYHVNHHSEHLKYGKWASRRLVLDGLEAKVTQAIIASNGTIWVVVGRDLASLDMEEENMNMVVTLGRMKLEMPVINIACSIILHFVLECEGLVYVVGGFMESNSEYIRIMDIRIWRLDLETVTLVEVDSIGNRAFLLNGVHGSSWCWADDNGVEPDSVYLLGPDKEENAYMYRLHEHSLTCLRPCPNLTKSWDKPAWVILPNHHQRSSGARQCQKRQACIKNDNKADNVANYDKAMDDNNTQQHLFSSLPADLIVVISKKLHFFDYLSFRETCRRFRSELPLLQWRTHNSLPLFLFSNNKGGDSCQVMDPCRNDSRRISTPFPSNLEKFIDFSKSGWLLFMIDGCRFEYLNLFTRDIKGDFPSFESMELLSSVGFSTYPTSSDCLTVGILGWYGFVLVAYHLYGEGWKMERVTDEEFEFHPGVCSPVFVDGRFYFMDQSGHLAVFEFQDGRPKINFFDKPQLLDSYYDSNHLLECDGQILAVIIGDVGSWVQVFRFSYSEQKWMELNDLGNMMLFLNRSTSFSAPAPTPDMRNRMYLPRLYRNIIVYYSLETRKFHTFDAGHSMNDLCGTAELLKCCWF